MFCLIYKCIVFSFSPADGHIEFCNGAVESRDKRVKDANARAFACFLLTLMLKGIPAEHGLGLCPCLKFILSLVVQPLKSSFLSNLWS